MYVGRGAGADDTGIYQVNGLDGMPVLAWRYRVIRLWQMPAEDLMAARQVAPLALLGQTQLARPERDPAGGRQPDAQCRGCYPAWSLTDSVPGVRCLTMR